MEELLQFIFGELDNRGINYMLSGSVALNSYTVPRFTRDIDIVIELQETNFDSFADIFTNRACYFHRESTQEAVFRQGMFNIIDWESGFKVDFIIKKENLFHQSEFSRKQRKIILGNTAGWVISPEDLVIAKFIWIQDVFSEQQLLDIRNLLTDNAQLDADYIKRWIFQLGLTNFNLFEP